MAERIVLAKLIFANLRARADVSHASLRESRRNRDLKADSRSEPRIPPHAIARDFLTPDLITSASEDRSRCGSREFAKRSRRAVAQRAILRDSKAIGPRDTRATGIRANKGETRRRRRETYRT